MQLDTLWMFMILFAFVVGLMSALIIAHLLYKIGTLNYSMAVMTERMIKVETILEERKNLEQ
jgi:hypothetical protein